jgi:hypothetical protein
MVHNVYGELPSKSIDRDKKRLVAITDGNHILASKVRSLTGVLDEQESRDPSGISTVIEFCDPIVGIGCVAMRL